MEIPGAGCRARHSSYFVIKVHYDACGGAFMIGDSVFQLGKLLICSTAKAVRNKTLNAGLKRILHRSSQLYISSDVVIVTTELYFWVT